MKTITTTMAAALLAAPAFIIPTHILAEHVEADQLNYAPAETHVFEETDYSLHCSRLTNIMEGIDTIGYGGAMQVGHDVVVQYANKYVLDGDATGFDKSNYTGSVLKTDDVQYYDDYCDYLRPSMEFAKINWGQSLSYSFDQAIIGAIDASGRDPYTEFIPWDSDDGRVTQNLLGLHGNENARVDGQSQDSVIVASLGDGTVDYKVRSSVVGIFNSYAVLPVNSLDGDSVYRFIESYNNNYLQLQAGNREVSVLVLDLRDNPGGYMPQALKLANLFIPSGSDDTHQKPILYVDRYFDHRTIYADSAETALTESDVPFADDGAGFPKFPKLPNLRNVQLKVLINERTASAAEILAAIMQDVAGAEVIGNRSYGKGSAQQMFLIGEDGLPQIFNHYERVSGFLKVTTGMHFPGNGLSNQGSGVIPNVRVDFGDADIRSEYLQSAIYDGSFDIDPTLTRASQKPEKICTLKEEFQGFLDEEVESQLPDIFKSVYVTIVGGKQENAIMADADVICALRDIRDVTNWVNIQDYKP